MADGFDINERSTWDWVDGGAVSAEQADSDGFLLNPNDPGSFYQVSNGLPHLHPCPISLVFNPMTHVCDWPTEITEAQIYDWAVAHGVVNDQR